jgi:hypothetical protein
VKIASFGQSASCGAGLGSIATSNSITLEPLQQLENPRVDERFFAKVAGAREATLTDIEKLVTAAERHIADVQAAAIPTRLVVRFNQFERI